MLTRILELADPVATCADDRLRFEAFSACCSVYGRVDLLPDAYDGETLGRGTTNVDFGPAMRSGAGGRPGHAAGWACRSGPPPWRSRRTPRPPSSGGSPLPSRWLRGFLEVQAIQAELAPAAELDAAGTRAFFRSIPKSPVEAAGLGRAGRARPADVPPRSRARAPSASPVWPASRLFDRVARHATSLRVFAADGDGSTGWQLDVPGARLTLVLSPEVWRGFSGEGRALHRLADAAPPAAVAAVRGALGWEPRLGVEALAATTGRSRDEVSGALAALALSGIVGYDLADGGFFRRELPFDLGRIERLQPRLRDARRLVEAGAVRIEADRRRRAIAGWVAGAGGVEYRVRSTEDGWRCTCPWYGRHRGDRGPCKHVLAVQLVAADDAG